MSTKDQSSESQFENSSKSAPIIEVNFGDYLDYIKGIALLTHLESYFEINKNMSKKDCEEFVTEITFLVYSEIGLYNKHPDHIRTIKMHKPKKPYKKGRKLNQVSEERRHNYINVTKGLTFNWCLYYWISFNCMRIDDITRKNITNNSIINCDKQHILKFIGNRLKLLYIK